MIRAADIECEISSDELAGTLSRLVDIASPTGEEKALAELIASMLDGMGIATHVQPLAGDQANARGHIKGAGRGKSLLLYAPLDTLTSGNPDEDLPYVGPELRTDMRAHATRAGDHVIGLGAHNPKGHVACILEAARVIKALDVRLAGDLWFGFGAGGMPTHSRPGLHADSGHGVGCARLLQEIPPLDGAIIAKSGTSVTWEEVGFIWIDVIVSGTHTYVGSRHLLPYHNAIAHAAKLVLALEDWFAERAEKHATDAVRPQGAVSFIEAGWERMPAFTPASCRFRIDLRFGPDTTPDVAESEFSKMLERLCREQDVTARFERVQTIHASRTPPDDPVVQTTIACWEELRGRQHEPFAAMSGATDANILRQCNVPTARIGLPKADLPNLDFQMGMNCVSVSAMRELTHLLVMSVIRYCGEVAHV
jgi:succinyl-diaminopimelate desuccinylase